MPKPSVEEPAADKPICGATLQSPSLLLVPLCGLRVVGVEVEDGPRIGYAAGRARACDMAVGAVGPARAGRPGGERPAIVACAIVVKFARVAALELGGIGRARRGEGEEERECKRVHGFKFASRRAGATSRWCDLVLADLEAADKPASPVLLN